jgi:hypothetical protein
VFGFFLVGVGGLGFSRWGVVPTRTVPGFDYRGGMPLPREWFLDFAYRSVTLLLQGQCWALLIAVGCRSYENSFEF